MQASEEEVSTSLSLVIYCVCMGVCTCSHVEARGQAPVVSQEPCILSFEADY